MGLILKLKKGEHLVVNGALIRFETTARIVLKTRSAVMHDRQIMRPEQANSPATRIYFAIQSAYMATAEEREEFRDLAHRRIAEFREASTIANIHALLDEIACAIDEEAFYKALQTTRQVIDYETALLELTGAGVARSGGFASLTSGAQHAH